MGLTNVLNRFEVEPNLCIHGRWLFYSTRPKSSRVSRAEFCLFMSYVSRKLIPCYCALSFEKLMEGDESNFEMLRSFFHDV